MNSDWNKVTQENEGEREREKRGTLLATNDDDNGDTLVRQTIVKVRAVCVQVCVLFCMLATQAGKSRQITRLALALAHLGFFRLTRQHHNSTLVKVQLNFCLSCVSRTLSFPAKHTHTPLLLMNWRSKHSC